MKTNIFDDRNGKKKEKKRETPYESLVFYSIGCNDNIISFSFLYNNFLYNGNLKLKSTTYYLKTYYLFLGVKALLKSYLSPASSKPIF